MTTQRLTFRTRRIWALSALACAAIAPTHVLAQHSVARAWNEVLLEAIRDDYARPTVHARNLFHSSVALYDAWAVFEPNADPYMFGQNGDEFHCRLKELPRLTDVEEGRKMAMSFASYRILRHRFFGSPGAQETLARFDSLFAELGYDKRMSRTDYEVSGSPAALGNAIAQCIIDLGMQDGSNEADQYANQSYEPVNRALAPTVRGNPLIADPNRWQPLALRVFIDQAGNPIPVGEVEFLGPEWGQVTPFALTSADRTYAARRGHLYPLYHDPGAPPLLGGDTDSPIDYTWGFGLVARWSAHLDPTDDTMVDISPGASGNTGPLPRTPEGIRDFYDEENGGDRGTGRSVNPFTGVPYESQIVRRGDYARVLAEFWADGPDSETPPGHWFTLLNYVNDHPETQRRFGGTGEVLDELEWDVKSYFVLGGAMHDAAVAAWGLKGWYDYVRPISAIRFMAGQGQSSDSALANYSPEGLPLIPGHIELIGEDDPLADEPGVVGGAPPSSNVGELKIKSWVVTDGDSVGGGVEWIVAEDWWPYQRPTFVTPPFAGYVSGHSTFSRAAAEVLTLLTGDEYFPGGMGEFEIPKDDFLVFEEGPSADMTLQWATYRDASDQASISRIWGGIHPPCDDIPGRIIGEKIGKAAYAFANQYFAGQVPVSNVPDVFNPEYPFHAYPSPARVGAVIRIALEFPDPAVRAQVYNVAGQKVNVRVLEHASEVLVPTEGLAAGMYLVDIQTQGQTIVVPMVVN